MECLFDTLRRERKKRRVRIKKELDRMERNGESNNHDDMESIDEDNSSHRKSLLSLEETTKQMILHSENGIRERVHRIAHSSYWLCVPSVLYEQIYQ